MGNARSWYQLDLEPPKPVHEYKYDPMIGFPNGRKIRTVKTTPEEMESAHVPLEMRDFCVDHWMKFLSCRADHFPLVYRCAHELHAYHDCLFEDHELRMKECEREKRLKQKLEPNES